MQAVLFPSWVGDGLAAEGFGRQLLFRGMSLFFIPLLSAAPAALSWAYELESEGVIVLSFPKE